MIMLIENVFESDFSHEPAIDFVNTAVAW